MPFRDLDAYIKQARRANSDRELFSCSEAAARQLGLPWLSNGVQKGPPIGVEEGPPLRI